MIKQKIRTGVFESNSSSSHVITLSKDTKNFFMDLSMVPDPDGEINIEGGEFGWEVEKYDDAWTKANYAAEYAKNNVSYLDMLRDVIQEQTQAKTVNINPSGHIDHQSDSVASVAFANKESLRNFIFNKNSVLFTSNDNGGGEIEGKNTDHPNCFDVDTHLYASSIELEGTDKKVFFYEIKPSKEQRMDAIRYLVDRHKINRGKNWNDQYEMHNGWSTDSKTNKKLNSFTNQDNSLTLYRTKKSESNPKLTDVIDEKDVKIIFSNFKMKERIEKVKK